MKNEFQNILLKFLKDTKADLEKKGLIPTLEEAIEQLEEQIREQELQK